jgi:DNA polymerase III alpha subunit
MFYDAKNGRVLLMNGKSILSSFDVARNIIVGKPFELDKVRVMQDFHSEKFDYLNKTSISTPIENVSPVSENHQHTEQDVEHLLSLITSSHRYVDSEPYNTRIAKEFEYFERSKNIIFILRCYDLVEKFRAEKKVWGVGRGSSCASLIMFLLCINDVNPLKYNIPFSELSKEVE